MTTRRTNPPNPGEAKDLNEKVYALSGLAAKAALLGIVGTFGIHGNLNIDNFLDIIKDATTYDAILRKDKG